MANLRYRKNNYYIALSYYFLHKIKKYIKSGKFYCEILNLVPYFHRSSSRKLEIMSSDNMTYA